MAEGLDSRLLWRDGITRIRLSKDLDHAVAATMVVDEIASFQSLDLERPYSESDHRIDDRINKAHIDK